MTSSVNASHLIDWSTGSSPYNVSDQLDGDLDLESGIVYVIVTSSILGVMILSTIIGNVFVIAAIILEKNLHSVANYLIASLAVADLMVAVLVMPFAVVNQVSSQWILGKELCDIWIFVDVLSCTSSILHLVAVAMDRFWAVTRVDYIKNGRSANRILGMIAISWCLSICISLPPLVGWKDSDGRPDDNLHTPTECLISQDWGYTVFSTVGAFYLPSIFMLFIYMRIYKAAKSRIRKKQFNPNRGAGVKYQTTNSARAQHTPPAITTTTTGGEEESLQLSVATQTPGDDNALGDRGSSIRSHVNQNGMPPLTTPMSTPLPTPSKSSRHAHKSDSAPKRSKAERNKEKLADKRERKAARTLAIITGSFITCWLPFFAIAIVRPFCGERCRYPDLLISITLWLGYFNSLLNPIIYTIFSPDFRMAFRKILFGKYHYRRRRRRRTERLGAAMNDKLPCRKNT